MCKQQNTTKKKAHKSVCEGDLHLHGLDFACLGYLASYKYSYCSNY